MKPVMKEQRSWKRKQSYIKFVGTEKEVKEVNFKCCMKLTRVERSSF